jgi:hypothetical protein
MQYLTWKMSIERALRIGYKSLLAPIACADMVTNGMSSNGIRYLKSIFALYMQSPILLLIMVCMNEVCNKVTHINGKTICAEGVNIINPGFDVTPHELITGIITEKGILRPDYNKSIAEAFKM